MTVQNQRPMCTAELVESAPGVGRCERGDECPVAYLETDFFAYRDAHLKVRAAWMRGRDDEEGAP
jgi:hypothetical protein